MHVDKDFAALLSLVIFVATFGTVVGKFPYPWTFDNTYGHGICQGSGDVHYVTYDNWRSIDFQGPCLYTLTRLCCGSCNRREDRFCPRTDFHVKVKQRPVGTPAYPLAYVDYTVVEICGYSVILDEGKWAVVETTHANYVPNPFTTYSSGVLSLPRVWDCENGTEFRLSNWGTNGIQFETKFMIIYNSPTYVKVKLSKKYKSKVCGICGNFNGNPEDDLVTRDGIDVSGYPDGSIWSVKDTLIGNSWKVYNPGQPDCEELNPDEIPESSSGRKVTPNPTVLCKKYLAKNRAMRKNCSAKVVGYALRECYMDAIASNLVSRAAIKEAICAAMEQMMANCPVSQTREGGSLEEYAKEYGCYQKKR